jgi:hypothetical protein
MALYEDCPLPNITIAMLQMKTHVSPKRRLPASLHGVSTQIIIVVVVIVRDVHSVGEVLSSRHGELFLRSLCWNLPSLEHCPWIRL